VHVTGTERPSERVVVYLTPTIKAELERIAEREDRSLSYLLRQLAADRVRADVEAETITPIPPPDNREDTQHGR
jgi:hypothetical protein